MAVFNIIAIIALNLQVYYVKLMLNLNIVFDVCTLLTIFVE